ncbi:hypothetical protein BDV40DRAFT_267853 [Aspergillus tamarii]|uniref:Uncharacterized protein n=1 Tax=Aspergillus tamarii TaxID=41984 RepID=A0A5N6URZ5_ASPTM|nr:hypothetical protein BDV40DRAFT_267853 [Aspergillus tamarii]
MIFSSKYRRLVMPQSRILSHAHVSFCQSRGSRIMKSELVDNRLSAGQYRRFCFFTESLLTGLGFTTERVSLPGCSGSCLEFRVAFCCTLIFWILNSFTCL